GSNSSARKPASSGKTMRWPHRPGGLPTSTTDPASGLVTLSYDASNTLTAIKDPDTAQWGYTYDSSHRITTLSDPRSETTTFSFNFAGEATSAARPDGTTDQISPLQLQGLVQNGSGTQGSPATSVLAAQAQATYTDPRTN